MTDEVEEIVDAVPGPEVVVVPPPATAAAKRQQRSTEATYTVQLKREFELDDESAEGGARTVVVWEDVATVTAPARSKRRGVIEKGLLRAGIAPAFGGEPLRARALDADSAHERPVEPQLRIG